jgi:hypothetical protein
MVCGCHCPIAGQTLLAPTLDDMESHSGINQSVAMAIAGNPACGTETYPSFQQVMRGFKKCIHFIINCESRGVEC